MDPVVCYIPMLEGQSELLRQWSGSAGDRFGIRIVPLPPADWNNDLTPWPAAPIFRKGKSFGGGAAAYLARLESEIIPSIEAQSDIRPAERWFAGVSLAGLFAVWSAANTRLFTRIAAVSGSFWFPGFTDWIRAQNFAVRSAYLSLGDREAEGRNPHLKGIASETAEVVRVLRAKGVDTTFEWTEGTHFDPLIPRLEQALGALVRK